MLLRNLDIYSEQGKIEKGSLRIKDGIIQEFGESKDLAHIDGEDVIVFTNGYKMIPGMIDLHIHGAGGADTMDATTQAIETIASILPQEGTTSFLATTMTQEVEAIERALSNVAQYIENHNYEGKAEVVGIHLEGPFISPKRIGAQPLHAV